MQLYTINATPVRTDVNAKVNEGRCQDYPYIVALELEKYGIDGFTIYEVKGYWKKTAEVSFKIEIATEHKAIVKSLCVTLRDMFNQDAVMLTNPDNSVEFI